MRFIDGLCDDIKAMVLIQRPPTLDSAYALALVQEEAMDNGKKKEYRRYMSKWFYDTSTGAATGAARCGSFVGGA
jgi:hypothetical protein